MRSKLVIGTGLAVALIAPAALPCGAPFGNGINADPRQDIVVAHKNGSETYVFQPRFCGSATEFGLVLPIPAKLSSQPALSKPEVFTHLVEISQPEYKYTTLCGSNTRGVGGSAGGTGVAGTGGTGATVISSGSVGFMDYTQLDAGSLSALTSWLNANGYPYDTQAESTFGYYVDKGWYFVAFKVSQGTFTGSTTCKDLGPIKLSFPTATPVVPTRMATARSRDSSGSLSYFTRFSWRIFGITAGAEQVGFTTGEDSRHVLNYSGLLAANDISYLDGLAVAGDRADKLTLTFDYGSVEPDVALTTATGKDYREVIEVVSYVPCYDGGTDVRNDSAVAPPPPDGGADAIRTVDAAVLLRDGPAIVVDVGTTVHTDVAVVVTPDAATDSSSPQNPPEVGKADAGVVAQPDSAVLVKLDAPPVVVIADAAVASADARPEEPAIKHGGGCSVAGSVGDVAPLLVIGIMLGLARRRRR